MLFVEQRRDDPVVTISRVERSSERKGKQPWRVMKRLLPFRKSHKCPESKSDNTPKTQLEASSDMQAQVSNHPTVVIPDRALLLEEQRRRSFVKEPAQLIATPVEEFLNSFRERGSELVCNAYLMQHPLETSISGTIFTSLPEDVFSVVDAQANLLDEYLISSQILATEAGDSILIDGLLTILRNLWYKQTHFRNSFLLDLESCIAAANDFLRMIEKIDVLMYNMAHRYRHLTWTEGKGDVTTSLLRREAADLISLFGSDSVYAAQRAATFVMRSIHVSNIPSELFSRDWEDRFVHNEVAVSMVRTFEDYLSDIHNYVDQDFLYHKVVVALVRSTVCFYLRCFVNKADQVRRAKKKLGVRSTKAAEQSMFMSASRAICRMTYDIEILRDYFYSIAKESSPLGRVVANELSVLVVILECMWLAVGQTGADSLEEFIVVVHKRTGADPDVTKHFLCDLWLLMAPSNEQHVIENAVKMMHSELQMVSARMKEKDAASPWKVANNDMAGLRLDDMLKSMYEDRIFQEKSSVCGNIITNVKDFREGSRKSDKEKTADLLTLHEKFKDTLKFEHFKRFLNDKPAKENSQYAGIPL